MPGHSVEELVYLGLRFQRIRVCDDRAEAVVAGTGCSEQERRVHVLNSKQANTGEGAEG